MLDEFDIKEQEHEELVGMHSSAPCDNDIIDIKAVVLQHQLVLDETKRLSMYYLLFCFTGDFIFSSCISIWILYIREVDPSFTSISIGIIAFSQDFCALVGILLIAHFTDKYGFDTISIFTCGVIIFGNLTQVMSVCFSNVLIVIFVLIFGMMVESLSGFDSEIIAIGWISKMLPFEIAAQYTGYYYMFLTAGFSLGLSFSGIVSYFISYYAAFVMASIFAFIRMILVIYKLKNSQKLLVVKQLVFVEHYKNEMLSEIISDKFPLCLVSLQTELLTKEPNKNHKMHWYLLVNLCSVWFQFGFVNTFDAARISWYPVYMKDKFNTSILISSLQIVLTIIWMTVVMSMLPGLLAKVDLKRRDLISQIALFIAYVFGIIITSIMVHEQNEHVFWLWLSLLALIYSVEISILEVMILEKIPKQETGMYTGIRSTIRFILTAISVCIIGVGYNKNTCDWFWIVMASLQFCALVIQLTQLLFLQIAKKHADM